MKVPVFWCLSAKSQAALMQFQYDEHGERLDIPTPPQTSRGTWLTVVGETSEEIDKIMRQPPSKSRGING